MANVSLVHLKKQFGASVAVSDFSLEIADGELVSFLGPSGCGKTTTLRMIAGFIDPTAGRILIGGADVTALPVHQRNTGILGELIKYLLTAIIHEKDVNFRVIHAILNVSQLIYHQEY